MYKDYANGIETLNKLYKKSETKYLHDTFLQADDNSQVRPIKAVT